MQRFLACWRIHVPFVFDKQAAVIIRQAGPFRQKLPQHTILRAQKIVLRSKVPTKEGSDFGGEWF
jgi:hypothetical protein